MVWLEGENIGRVLRGRWRILRCVHGDLPLLGVGEIFDLTFENKASPERDWGWG
jgi:hypothetical protein